MTEGLRVRVAQLEAAIRAHRDARGDSRCWLDDLELYRALGEREVPDEAELALPDREAFLRRCEAFWERRQAPGSCPWITVEELQAASPDDLRAEGWTVAVHNDYRLGGEAHTFWLLTHPETGRFVKGEGRTDAEALARVRTAVHALEGG